MHIYFISEQTQILESFSPVAAPENASVEFTP